MDRTHIEKHRISELRNDDYVPGTAEERLALVWPLTRELVSLTTKYDAERRLQRHVVRVFRGPDAFQQRDLADAEALEQMTSTDE